MEMIPDRGETVMWAPHVDRHQGVYHMFVATGGPDPSAWGITLATSPDLWTWTRTGAGPLFRDGYHARDPMVCRVDDDLWAMFYTATERREGGHHVVAYRTSADLRRWSDRNVAYRDVHEGTAGGPTESPFVFRRESRFFLFKGPRPYDSPVPGEPYFRQPGYIVTDVFASKDWRHWTDYDHVGRIPCHAAELVEDGKGTCYISSAGVGQGGLSLAELRWNE
jgi:beta-fructofuranosidase